MKKILTTAIVGILLTIMPIAACAEEGVEASVKFMETLVSQLRTLLAADNVLGTPIEFGDTKIIPVVGYGFGFGAGSGSGMHSQTENVGSGAGGGAGGGVMPTSILVVTKDGEVKVLTAKKDFLSELASSLQPIALEAIKAKQAGGQKPEQSQEKTAE